MSVVSSISPILVPEFQALVSLVLPTLTKKDHETSHHHLSIWNIHSPSSSFDGNHESFSIHPCFLHHPTIFYSTPWIQWIHRSTNRVQADAADARPCMMRTVLRWEVQCLAVVSLRMPPCAMRTGPLASKTMRD